MTRPWRLRGLLEPAQRCQSNFGALCCHASCPLFVNVVMAVAAKARDCSKVRCRGAGQNVLVANEKNKSDCTLEH
jgi:hypothetical protein